MAEIKAVTDATFEQEVLHNDKPVVVDFWATWCGPCKMVAPEMEKIAAKYDGKVDVVKVDVDANPGLSQAFRPIGLAGWQGTLVMAVHVAAVWGAVAWRWRRRGEALAARPADGLPRGV